MAWKWEGFFSLKYLLLHLLPSFGFRLFRAVLILKTPSTHQNREKLEGRKKNLLQVKMVSASV